MKANPINKDVPLDKRGQNANIKFHIPNEDIMRLCGFNYTYTYKEWIYSIGLSDTISLTITINSDCEGVIDVLDDDFLQPYDFQGMILEKGDKVSSFVKNIQNTVYVIMSNLLQNGIISGWDVGDYI